jgi:hypothetical protein
LLKILLFLLTVDAVICDANSGIAQSVGNYSVSKTTGITFYDNLIAKSAVTKKYFFRPHNCRTWANSFG